MTIGDLISKVDSFKPNSYTREEKIDWISSLDGMVRYELIGRYKLSEEELENYAYEGYEATTPDTQELLVPEPYADELYQNYLISKIDMANNEIGRYNNSVALFNNAYEKFEKYINRTHQQAIKRKMKFWG